MSVGQPLVSRNGWLWWKEFRMLAPLVALLVGVAGFLFIISIFLDGKVDAFRHATGLTSLVPLVFPSLFAAGAGAILVGQERELRTVHWMSALPISPRQWILVKLLVATVGLGVMWVLAACCLVLLGDSASTVSRWRIGGARGMADAPIGYPLWIVHSIYLTLCGFYMSWRIKNQFHAIIGVLVLACLPLALSELFRAMLFWLQRQLLSAVHVHALTFTITCILIPIVATLAYRAAMTTLSPQSAPAIVTRPAEQRLVASSFWSTAPLMGWSSASMIWQSIRSAPVALTVTVAIILAGISLPLVLAARGADAGVTGGAFFVLATLMVPLGMSWLGVLVFQNDGAAERLRFLADRGISPTKVFVWRQAVPLAALATCLIFYVVAAEGSVSRVRSDGLGLVMPSLLSVAMVAWVLYSVSQWTSQLFRTLVLSVIVSPIVAMLTLGWYTFAIVSLRTPIWALAICSLVPVIATWRLMPRFMDMRDRPRSFLVAVGVIAITIGVPIGAAAWAVTRVPRMESDARSKLLAEGETLWKSESRRVPMTLAYPTMIEDIQRKRTLELGIMWLDDYPATPSALIPALAQLRDQPNSSGTMDDAVLHVVFNRLMKERLRFELTGDWETFSSWMVAASEMVSALRRSRLWADQDRADVIEIWIVDTLRLPSIAPHRSDQAYKRAVGNLPSKVSRNGSRRDAVLTTWASHGQQVLNRNRVQDRGLKWQPPYLASWMVERRIESIVATAIAALGDDEHWLHQMHDLQLLPGIPFESGPYASRFRGGSAIELIRSGPYFPSQFWGMDWEAQVDKLIRENSP